MLLVYGDGQALLLALDHAEPERELPWAVATLRQGEWASADAVAEERARIERMLLRGSQRRWLAYLHEVIALIVSSADLGDPGVARARSLAGAVISNHHALLLGLPGPGAAWTAADRATLHSITTEEGPE